MHLKEIIVSDCPFISDRGLQIAASQCLELASLAVNETRVSSFGIKSFFFIAANNLQYLDLSLLTISNELFLSMGEPQLRLKSLILAGYKGITAAGILDSSFFCLLKDYHHLEELEMESTGLRWGTSQMVSDQECWKLKSLNVATWMQTLQLQ